MTPKIADFGLSKEICGEETVTSGVSGTIQWTAPEMLEGNTKRKVLNCTPSHQLISGTYPTKMDVRAGSYQSYRTFDQRPIEKRNQAK